MGAHVPNAVRIVLTASVHARTGVCVCVHGKFDTFRLRSSNPLYGYRKTPQLGHVIYAIIIQTLKITLSRARSDYRR